MKGMSIVVKALTIDDDVSLTLRLHLNRPGGPIHRGWLASDLATLFCNLSESFDVRESKDERFCGLPDQEVTPPPPTVKPADDDRKEHTRKPVSEPKPPKRLRQATEENNSGTQVPMMPDTIKYKIAEELTRNGPQRLASIAEGTRLELRQVQVALNNSRDVFERTNNGFGDDGEWGLTDAAKSKMQRIMAGPGRSL